MKIDIDKLHSRIPRKFSFKYIPEYFEEFNTNIDENQVIPLSVEIFEVLDWPVVYYDRDTVEAKRKGDFNNLTEKITISKEGVNRIKVHSCSLKGNFVDFGNNSKRTGLFIALFEEIALIYQENGKLNELEKEFSKKINWVENYEIPKQLDKPNEYEAPNSNLAIISGLTIAILLGVLVALLTNYFTHLIGLYEVCLGFGFAYFFGKVLLKTNYTNSKHLELLVGGMILVIFISNLYTQYLLIITENSISNLSFFQFVIFKFKGGMIINNIDFGWIGLLVVWVLQLVIPYFIAFHQISIKLAIYCIDKIPDQVIEYCIYLIEIGKSENDIKTEMSTKGWNEEKDQKDLFQAIAELGAINAIKRE